MAEKIPIIIGNRSDYILFHTLQKLLTNLMKVVALILVKME